MPYHYRLLISLLLLCFCTTRLAAQQPESEPSEIQLQLEQILDSGQAEIQGENIVTQDARDDFIAVNSAGRKVDPATIDWNAYRKNIPFTLRQEAGPNNALGQVKFIFPNPYFVYMHDTPQRALFERPQRTFSSGCIRVENPLQLVQLVLQDRQNFGPAELQEILHSGRSQRVLLEKPIPVLILYLTAALDPSGQAMYYRDIYQRDAAVLRLLDGPVTADLL